MIWRLAYPAGITSNHIASTRINFPSYWRRLLELVAGNSIAWEQRHQCEELTRKVGLKTGSWQSSMVGWGGVAHICSHQCPGKGWIRLEAS